MAKALQIVTHAYINNDIVSRATALKGASMFMRPTKRGSFLIEIVTIIEQYPATLGLAAPIFYDFVKFSLKKATGCLNATPKTPSLKKAVDKDEPFFDELAEALEGSLQKAHRPVGNDVDQITIERSRSELNNPRL